MSLKEIRAKKSLEVVLDYVITRLNKLEGANRLSFAKEYKEWLVDDQIKEKVWFSIPLKKESGINED